MSDDIAANIVEYWNTQPCNINHSRSSIGTAQYWQEVTDKRYTVEPHIREFLKFDDYSNCRVLDVGCGIGSDAEQFVRRGANYVGIDVSSVSIDLCKQRFKLFDLAADFRTMDAADTAALQSLGKFDLVISIGVLHHSPNITKILSNIHSVLEKDGILKIMLYSKNSWKYAMIQQGLDQFEAQAGCPYAVAYSKEEVCDLLEQRFEIVDFAQDHCFMYNVDLYKQGILQLEPWWAAMSAQMREAVRKQLGWHLLVTAKKI